MAEIIATATVTTRVTNRLTNATINPELQNFERGTTQTFTFIAKQGYYFETAPYGSYSTDGLSTNRIVAEKVSDMVYTLTVDIDVGSYITFVANATEKSHMIPIIYRVSNAFVEPNISETPAGQSITFIVTAYLDCVFGNSLPYGQYVDEIGNHITIQGVKSEDIVGEEIYKINIPDNAMEGQPITITANAQIKTEYTDRYGYLTIFTPTAEEIKKILSGRYINYTGETVVTHDDLGNYIASLLMIFANIPHNNTQTVKLGTYDTGVSCGIADTDIITVDCGSVTVSELLHNALDYTKTDIEINLPFIGIEKLDSVKIMNKTITLEYKVNVLTGDCLAIIKDEDIILYTFDGNISYELPYNASGQNGVINNLHLNNKYLYGFTPFMYVYSPIQYGDNGRFGNNDNATKLISEFTGYVVFDEVSLKVNCFRNELTMIESLLKQGVIL